MRAQAGQSTLEYVALILLAMLVLAGAAAAASSAGIAQAFAAQFARAICVAGGGDCDRDRAPCVIASRTTLDDLSVRVAVVRLSGGRTLLRERRSDGAEVVTVIERGGAGLEVSAGAEAGIGSRSIGASLGGGAEARFGRGRSWRVAGSRAADELVRRIGAVVPAAGRVGLVRRTALAPPPPPDMTFSERGLDAQLQGRLGAVGLRLDAEDLMGSRADRITGERTFTIRRRSDLVGTIGLGVGSEAEGLARGDERYALTVDATGRPRDLAIVETHRLQGGVALPRSLRVLIGRRLPPLRRGRIAQVERHLDLSDHASLAAAGAFVRALREPRLRMGDAVAVSRALRARLDAAGTALARVYDLDARHTGLHGSVSAGAGLGGGAEQAVESARLVAASARGLDGSWREREDCLRAGGAG